MNDKNMNPLYRGRYIRNILADNKYIDRLLFEKGTVLIMDLEMDFIKVFFQLGSDYIYARDTGSFKMHYLPVLPGSAIDGTGRHHDADSLLPYSIRIPTLDELHWYEGQDTV